MTSLDGRVQKLLTDISKLRAVLTKPLTVHNFVQAYFKNTPHEELQQKFGTLALKQILWSCYVEGATTHIWYWNDQDKTVRNIGVPYVGDTRFRKSESQLHVVDGRTYISSTVTGPAKEHNEYLNVFDVQSGEFKLLSPHVHAPRFNWHGRLYALFPHGIVDVINRTFLARPPPLFSYEYSTPAGVFYPTKNDFVVGAYKNETSILVDSKGKAVSDKHSGCLDIGGENAFFSFSTTGVTIETPSEKFNIQDTPTEIVLDVRSVDDRLFFTTGDYEQKVPRIVSRDYGSHSWEFEAAFLPYVDFQRRNNVYLGVPFLHSIDTTDPVLRRASVNFALRNPSDYLQVDMLSGDSAPIKGLRGGLASLTTVGELMGLKVVT